MAQLLIIPICGNRRDREAGVEEGICGSDRPKIKELAQNIIDSQQQKVDQMQ
jgi:hypothetical protein